MIHANDAYKEARANQLKPIEAAIKDAVNRGLYECRYELPISAENVDDLCHNGYFVTDVLTKVGKEYKISWEATYEG